MKLVAFPDNINNPKIRLLKSALGTALATKTRVQDCTGPMNSPKQEPAIQKISKEDVRMAAKALSARQTKEILRVRCEPRKSSLYPPRIAPKPEVKLLMHPKISLTPHIGAATLEAQDRIGEELGQQIISILG